MKRSAIKTDLFASAHHREKIDQLGDPLIDIETHINFSALAAEVDTVAPCPVSTQGGRPPYPTETMVRILVLKRLYNLSDEQMEYQLLDRMSYNAFVGPTGKSSRSIKRWLELWSVITASPLCQDSCPVN